jgi:hypothetical protein
VGRHGKVHPGTPNQRASTRRNASSVQIRIPLSRPPWSGRPRRTWPEVPAPRLGGPLPGAPADPNPRSGHHWAMRHIYGG